jgi:hypothetical protein
MSKVDLCINVFSIKLNGSIELSKVTDFLRFIVQKTQNMQYYKFNLKSQFSIKLNGSIEWFLSIYDNLIG